MSYGTRGWLALALVTLLVTTTAPTAAADGHDPTGGYTCYWAGDLQAVEGMPEWARGTLLVCPPAARVSESADGGTVVGANVVCVLHAWTEWHSVCLQAEAAASPGSSTPVDASHRLDANPPLPDSTGNPPTAPTVDEVVTRCTDAMVAHGCTEVTDESASSCAFVSAVTVCDRLHPNGVDTLTTVRPCVEVCASQTVDAGADASRADIVKASSSTCVVLTCAVPHASAGADGVAGGAGLRPCVTTMCYPAAGAAAGPDGAAADAYAYCDPLTAGGCQRATATAGAEGADAVLTAPCFEQYIPAPLAPTVIVCTPNGEASATPSGGPNTSIQVVCIRASTTFTGQFAFICPRV